MENDTRVFFCSIEGNTNLFGVTISTSKRIFFLKKAIWEECNNGALRDVNAQDLVLWQVSRFSGGYQVCS